MDNLEKAKVMRKSENFSTSKYFDFNTYITTDDRKNARVLEDILPEKFETLTEETYKKDLESLQMGGDGRGLKEDSVFNQIDFFHCTTPGFLPPCVMHDVFQGMYLYIYCVYMKILFKNKIFEQKLL